MSRITVIIPTHNRPGLLAQAIASVAAQDYPREGIELIVVHDGPGTGVPDLLGLPGTYLEIPKMGLSAAINAGFAISRGRYITVLADDDLMYPHKLSTLVGALEAAGPFVDAVYALARHSHAEDDGPLLIEPLPSIKFLREHPVVTWDTIAAGHGLRIHGTAFLYRRQLWDKAGPWDTTLDMCEEWEFHLRLLSLGAVFHGVQSFTDIYRVHAGQKSGRKTRRTVRRGEVRALIAARYPADLVVAAR